MLLDGCVLLLHPVVIKFHDVSEEILGSVFKMEELVWEDVELIRRKNLSL